MYRMNDAKRTLRKIRKSQEKIAREVQNLEGFYEELQNCKLEVEMEIDNLKANYLPKNPDRALIEW